MGGGVSATNKHIEDFTTTAYMDSSTTAHWDTDAQKLHLWEFQMTELGSYATAAGSSPDVVMHGGYAYFIDQTGLTIFDISDRANPTPIGNLPLGGEGVGVFVSGTRALVADGSWGLRIVNVSDPTSPTLISTYNTTSFAIWS